MLILPDLEYTKRKSLGVYESVFYINVFRQSVKLEVAESESFPPITPFKCVSTAKLYRGTSLLIAQN